jgi:hypothetical protein
MIMIVCPVVGIPLVKIQGVSTLKAGGELRK